ncbi:hypothetical protein QFC20_007523 [Naganishia adeliensis]|uniref:Uncharacterized protein n=1 Tax=Naganishia adeliensis TaxID=92952 RepID=A0ACC2UXQ5_9TREE|nr:hypothetical protein QFC20_007523 [Naganishia adeliensis]
MRSNLEDIEQYLPKPGAKAGVIANGDLNGLEGCGMVYLSDTTFQRRQASRRQGERAQSAWEADLMYKAWEGPKELYGRDPSYQFIDKEEDKDAKKILAFFHSQHDHGLFPIPIIDLGAPFDGDPGSYAEARAQDLLSVISATYMDSGDDSSSDQLSDRACNNVLGSVVLVPDMLASSAGDFVSEQDPIAPPSGVDVKFGSASFLGNRT